MNTDPDKLYNGKSIYDVSKGELFWRNFLAGFARGLGNFLFTILIFIIITGMLAQFMAPFINPMLNTLESISTIMSNVSQAQPEPAQ